MPLCCGSQVSNVYLERGATRKTYHPDQPLNRLPVLITIILERDLVLLVVLLTKIQLHAGAFEDTLRLAGSLVDDCWNATVRWRRRWISVHVSR